MTDYTKYRLSKKEMGVLILFSVILSTASGWLFFDTYFGVVITPVVVILLKKVLEDYLCEQRLKNIRNQFKDVLFFLSSAFASGLHLQDGLESAYIQIKEIHGPKAEMAEELHVMVLKLKEVAWGEMELWQDLSRRTGLEDIEDFSEVFAACRDAGGDMISAVEKAASMIVEKINIENEMRAMFAQKKTEGRMVGTMPVIMILFLRLTSPGYLGVMYETIPGRIMMLMSMIAIGYSIYLTERITRVEV